MKKAVKLLGITMFLGLGLSNLNAQRSSGSYYNTGIGLLVDVGDGATLVGPHVKHFFSRNNAGEFAVLFGSGARILMPCTLPKCVRWQCQRFGMVFRSWAWD